MMDFLDVQTHWSRITLPNVASFLCIIASIRLCHFLLTKSLLDVIRGYKFLLRGRDIIRDATHAHGEKPFSLPIPNSRVHIMRSEDHFLEINKSHTSQLSLHAAVKQWFSPQHTLGGFQFPDRRDIEGMNLLRAIRSANSKLLYYTPRVFDLVTQEFDKAISGKTPTADGYVEIPLYRLMQDIALRTNTLFIIGEDAANDSKFLKMSRTYTEKALVTAELCRLAPNWGECISFLVQGRQKPRKYVFDDIAKYAEIYLAQGEADEDKMDVRNITVLELLTRCYPPEWSIPRIVREIATLWMPSIILLSSTSTQLFQDILSHPEHIPALREELSQHTNPPRDFSHQNLAFLESFMMESARVNCYEATTAHRVALQDYTFADGYKVSKGHWVEFNLQAMFSDPKKWPQPDVFDPYRHLASGRKFKDVSMEWPMWGVPKLACPGRVLTDLLMKILVSYVLENFDCKISKKEGLNFQWRESQVPSSSVDILVRKRKE